MGQGTKTRNFWKSSKWRGVHFQLKNLYNRFWTFILFSFRRFPKNCNIINWKMNISLFITIFSYSSDRYIFLFLRSLYFLFPQIAVFLYISDCYIFLFPQTALRLTAPALAFQDHRCLSQGEDALARFLHLASALYLFLHLYLYLYLCRFLYYGSFLIHCLLSVLQPGQPSERTSVLAFPHSMVSD